MRTITKIACRVVGAVGMGMSLYDATRVGGLFSKNESQVQQQKHLEKTYFNSRTLDSTSYTKNAIRKKVYDLETRNPLPTLWGKIKGGLKGFAYGLGENLPLILFSSLALIGKNTMAKIGAIGAVVDFCYTTLREGFGFGKRHPMN